MSLIDMFISSMPKLLPSSDASVLLSMLVYFEGIKIPFTLEGPSASVATAALKALSIPPDIPNTTPGKLFFST